ncbi:MAG: class I SAM-dependent methyltransferase [Hyphomicrobiales bacterium]|nr:class I SAM-dependent methyltransferase [Amphiplicatus sp.]MCC2103939.1 class I SAM-dependent methyltransferase [Hyphomicrobiales bacterium]MCC2108177.1 class I SAM-dependent methyltransferase [Hyphomicrobiales bacterium]
MRNIYYHFRGMGTSKGEIFGLPGYELGSKTQDTKQLKIRFNNKVELGPIPVADATYPKLIRAGDILPSFYFEISRDLIEKHLNDDMNVVEIFNGAGDRLTESGIFGFPGRVLYPIPNSENIGRVAATVGPGGFVSSGASWYVNIVDLIRREQGKIDKGMAVLDWGVGCGRVMRYFIQDGWRNVVGIDIDQLNIDWCNANLPHAHFERCEFDPPTRFADGAFDVIYGHSVFTHLDKKSEQEWLGELSRLLKPHGFACVTFGSEFTCALNWHSVQKSNPTFLWPLARNGRQDFGADTAGVDEGRDGYYRLVAHSREYITKNWSSIFDISRIIPGFANNQDAVILRKKNK